MILRKTFIFLKHFICHMVRCLQRTFWHRERRMLRSGWTLFSGSSHAIENQTLAGPLPSIPVQTSVSPQLWDPLTWQLSHFAWTRSLWRRWEMLRNLFAHLYSWYSSPDLCLSPVIHQGKGLLEPSLSHISSLYTRRTILHDLAH
jgi:hypothetical protein